MRNYDRREWLRDFMTINAALALPYSLFSCRNNKDQAADVSKKKNKKAKTILVVSGWQDVNIGDIAHTPGLLHILEIFLPEANVILWKKSAGKEVEVLLQNNFPKVEIIYGEVDEEKNVKNTEVIQAFEKADIMIHGSGPSVVGRENLQAWKKHSSKPYGIFGTTIEHVDNDLKVLLDDAAFVFTRETKSLEVLKGKNIQGDHIAFAPDATFYFNLADTEKAKSFLEEHQLEDKKFICAIPRLRITPYYKFKSGSNYTPERIEYIEKLNKSKKEEDHAKLREAMIAWVRETGNKVLVCPEMTYQVDIMDELLIDPLPENIKPYVVKRGYWLPDEAASVYARAHTVLSFEAHSPILAAVNGTPMFYLRQPEDTIKGQMYYDLGFEDWVFEIEETEGEEIADMLREVWKNYGKAKNKVITSMEKIDKIYKERTKVVSHLLAAAE